MILLFSNFKMVGQKEEKTGTVTFLTSENIYVRFASTQGIEVGDTLYFENTPCLLVSKKSTSSCVCSSINDCSPNKDDEITFLPTAEPEETEIVPPPVLENESKEDSLEYLEILPVDPPKKRFEEKLRARISLASYSSFSSGESKDRHSGVARLSFNAEHIKGTGFSIESYLNFRQNISEELLFNDPGSKLFRIYNLALRYDIDSTFHMILGRKINRNVSSIGAIDGLQIEKQWGRFFTGVVAGYRPDIYDFGFNSNLLEYGAFIGVQESGKKIHTRTSIGFMEQKNAGEIDRRYLHIQSVQNIGRNFQFFGSAELDVYKQVQGEVSNQAQLTNLLLSARYRFNRKYSLSLSYDNRKRIIYYETYRTEIERLLEEDIARQGIRARLMLRPFKRIFTGISYSKRFQSDLGNKSDNINAYVNFSRFPGIGGNLSLRYNMNQSIYLNSNIYSIRYSRNAMKNKLSLQFYYRLVDYNYISSDTRLFQHYMGGNLNYKLTKNLRIGLFGEISERQSVYNYRINTKLIQRF